MNSQSTLAIPVDGLIVASPTDAGVAEFLASSLSAFGLHIRVCNLDELTNETIVANLLIGFATSTDAEHLQHLDLWCNTRGARWLRCVVAPAAGFADAGPCFWPGKGDRLVNFNRMYLRRRGALPDRPGYLAQLEFWTRIVAQPLAEFCRRLRTVYKSNKFVRLDTDDFCSKTNRAVILNEIEESSSAAPFLIFDATVAHSTPAFSMASLKARNRSYVAESLRPNEYPNSRKRACSTPAVLGSLSVSELLVCVSERDAPLGPEHIAALLLYGVGHRSSDLSRNTVKRFAGSAGNMGSSTVSYLLPSGNTGIPSLFVYQAGTHEEVQFEPYGLSHKANRLLSSLDYTDKVEAAFFFSFDIDRIQAKYGGFGYRLALMDVGVALSQMSLVARAFGYYLLVAHRISRFKASRLLNLREDKTHMALTATLRINSCASIATPEQQLRRNIYLKPTLYLSPVTQAARLRRMALRLSSRYSQLGAAEIKPPSRKTLSESRPSLIEVLLSRHSVQRFASSTVSKKTLETLLRMSDSADRYEWAGRAELELSFYVLLGNGRRSAAEFFRYHRQTDTLQPAGKEIVLQESLLYVDPHFQHAPAAVWITGNLAQVKDPREYEELLIRAGAAANRVWLLGIENGLWGTIVAGVLPEQAVHLLALDRWRERPLCAVVLGFRDKFAQAGSAD